MATKNEIALVKQARITKDVRAKLIEEKRLHRQLERQLENHASYLNNLRVLLQSEEKILQIAVDEINGEEMHPCVHEAAALDHQYALQMISKYEENK